MKNSFGQALTLTLFGESHGPAVGAVLDGMAPGVPVDPACIDARMQQRRAIGALSTPRQEEDRVEILSGVYQGRTTGTPLTLLIHNRNTHSADYADLQDVPRPGHADYTAYMKYHGYADPRGGGHFSGRITAAVVAAGAICSLALRRHGIAVGTHIARLAGIRDAAFSAVLSDDVQRLQTAVFPVLDAAAGERMQAAILAARQEGDSVGGVLETAVIGLPAGVGEPWFDTVESVLSHALFAIPAVKGVEFGDGFALADMRGSEANDPFCMREGTVETATNRAGGILGGITTGMPLIFRLAVKPTPSISRPQRSVSLSRGEERELTVTGRHDPAILHRARAVVDAMTAFCLADLLTVRYGTDFLAAEEAMPCVTD